MVGERAAAHPDLVRRVAAEVQDRINGINDVSVTHLVGGQKRQVRVLLDPAKVAA